MAKVIKYAVYQDGRRVEDEVIECNECSRPVELTSSFTITCENCGADYNSSGQQLAPREQWGEETGEHWTECY